MLWLVVPDRLAGRWGSPSKRRHQRAARSERHVAADVGQQPSRQGQHYQISVLRGPPSIERRVSTTIILKRGDDVSLVPAEGRRPFLKLGA